MIPVKGKLQRGEGEDKDVIMFVCNDANHMWDLRFYN